jgi:DNA polymerase-3 subunit epsilon
MKINRPICFFDIETTGVSTTKDRIVQIACIKIDLDGNKEEKKLLINPTIPIPKEATDVHGISDEMVKDAPLFKNISKALYFFFKDCDIAGYNSDNFDVPLLIEEFARVGIQFLNWEYNLVDVLKHERLLHSNKLGDVYKRYTGQDLDGAHDALNDVRATVEILFHQIEGKSEITPEEIDSLCQGENKRFDIAGKAYYDKEGIVRWTFGKNINQPVLQDLKYLEWVLNNDFPSESKNKLITLKNQ